jgi:predicted ATPase
LAFFNPTIEQQIVLSFQFSSTVASRMFLASSLWMLGYPEQAPHYVAAALTLAQDLNHTPSKAYALAASCFFYHYFHDSDWILEKTEQLIRISQDEGFLLWFPVAKIYHGWAISERGNEAEGIAEIKTGIQLFWETGTTVILPHIMVMLAEACCKSGQLEEALTAVEAGMYEVENRNERHMEPELYRLKAKVLLQKNACSQEALDLSLEQQAEVCFLHAVEIAQTQGAKMLELRSAVGLSELWQNQGRQQDAYRLLSDIYNQFTEGWNLPDLKAARLLLDNLAVDQ